MLRENILRYSDNIDVTNYVEGERQTLNPVGRAYAPTVWKYFRVSGKEKWKKKKKREKEGNEKGEKKKKDLL